MALLYIDIGKFLSIFILKTKKIENKRFIENFSTLRVSLETTPKKTLNCQRQKKEICIQFLQNSTF